MTLQNDLFLRALRGEHTERVPVWMMRQAGRYLPEYIALRDKYDFFTRVQTPELAAEITLQPIDIVGVDAAIIFSDILVVPQAMGLEVQMLEGKGPFLPITVSGLADVAKLNTQNVEEELDYVMKALQCTKQGLAGRVPLIGFAGAPYTLLCYMVEGKGSKTWDKAKQFLYTETTAAHALLQKITDVTIDYLKAQVAAGADAVQVFDSWSGALSKSDFDIFCLPYLKQIAEALAPHAPVILFAKGSWYAIEELAATSASALGIDWCTSPQQARAFAGANITLQGNFDPSKLLGSIPFIREEVKKMIEGFGKQRYIANLGHGITPNVPVANAKAFVEAVKEFGVS